MSTMASTILLFMLTVILSGCSDNYDRRDHQVIRQVSVTSSRTSEVLETRVIDGANKFGVQLLVMVTEANRNSNVLISPLSISMMLRLILDGARGTTADSMMKVLGLEGMTREEITSSYRRIIEVLRSGEPGVSAQLANALWIRKDLVMRPDFVTRNEKYLGAGIRNIDFNDAAARMIDAWVKEKTHGMIEKIVPERISALTMMYLINAMYFKGEWSDKFDGAITTNARFHLADGGTVRCVMMNRKGKVSYAEDEDFKLVELPYRSRGNEVAYSMICVIPKEEKTIYELIADLSNGDSSIITARRIIDEVDLSLPKFNIESTYTLSNQLKVLGMGNAFDSTADFSAIGGEQGDLFIGNVVHKAVIDVNEEGAEAAAGSGIEVKTFGAPPSFVADRPFIFMIRESHSGMILFIGTIMRPNN